MAFTLQKVPAGVELNACSQQVFDVLTEHTMFPWAILQAQCGIVKLDPAELQPSQLQGTLTDLLAVAVERFTTPEKGQAARQALLAIATNGNRPARANI